MADLKDLIGKEGLQVDEYVGTQVGNLTVIGWNGLKGNSRKYFVNCIICCQDKELHGQGVFLTSKGHLERGVLPCGCSSRCGWTKEQYIVRLKRICSKKGVLFKGFDGEFTTANKTRVILECDRHGQYANLTISSCLDSNTDKGCAKCFSESTGNSHRKKDEDMIKMFMERGKYPEGTIFTRSDTLDKNGHKKYWNIYCPVCETSAEAHIVGLYKGSRSCDCSYQVQKESYINLIKDGDNIIALKFGVARDSIPRTKQQKSYCIYTVVPYGVWSYPDTKSCKLAERVCMKTLEVGVLTKQEMSDGYTETTPPYNMERIIKIFEEYGGIRNI